MSQAFLFALFAKIQNCKRTGYFRMESHSDELCVCSRSICIIHTLSKSIAAIMYFQRAFIHSSCVISLFLFLYFVNILGFFTKVCNLIQAHPRHCLGTLGSSFLSNNYYIHCSGTGSKEWNLALSVL